MPASAAGPNGSTSATRSAPSRSDATRSKRTPSRPVAGPCVAGPVTPRCDAFSSPTMRLSMRRSSGAVRAPATCGAQRARTASQSAPWYRSS